MVLIGSKSTADVVINEIMFYPPVVATSVKEQPAHEFIELYNTGMAAVDLTGWELRGGVDLILPTHTLQSGEYVVVAADPAALLVLHPELAGKVMGPYDGKLSNSSERLVLDDSFGEKVDEVEYADEGEWAERVRGPDDLGHKGWEWSSKTDGGGYSLELESPLVDNSIGGAWKASEEIGGSPGATNGVLLADVAPLLTDLRHKPDLPFSNQPVRVSVNVSAGTGSGAIVQLFYRSGVGAFHVLSMVDDGTSGDLESGDGDYSCQIPAQADGTVIEYFALVCDEEGLSRRYPMEPVSDVAGEQSNYLYLVNDSFDRENPTNPNQPNLFVVLTETEREELNDMYVNAKNSNAKMNATLISWIGDSFEVRQNLGARNRGNSSRSLLPYSLRLTFRSDDPWEGRSSLDISGRFGFSRLVGAAVFQNAGIEVAEAVATQLTLNGVDNSLESSPSYGFYAAIESFGGEWADNHFPSDPDGNFYKVIRQGLSNNTTVTRLRNRYSKETNKSEDDFSDLNALLTAIYESSDAEYFDAISSHIDIDQWLRFLAVSSLINNRETNISTGDADDFSLYRGEVDPRFRLVAHDLDTVMSTNITLPIDAAAGNSGLVRFMAHPQIRPRYYNYIREYAATLFSDAEMVPLLQELLGELVPQTLIDQLVANNSARRAFLLAAIEDEFSVSTSLPVVHGMPESTTAIVEISGTADAAITYGVMVGGEVADYDSIDGTWTIPDAALFPGENSVLVQVLGEQGQEIDRQRYFIRYNSGTMTPFVNTPAGTTQIMTAEGGPYLMHLGKNFVLDDASLIIEPGATLYFPEGARLRTKNGALISAIGTDLHRIQITRIPSDGNEEFHSLILDGELGVENTLSHVDMRYAGGVDNYQIQVIYSRVLIENCTWSNSLHKVLRLSDPYLQVRNCTFPNITAETVTGTGLGALGGELILDNNVFGTSALDVVDFSGGQRPGPIIQVTNNVFLGSGGESLDLDGADAHIEGNVFMNIHKVDSGNSTTNAISTGIHDGHASNLTVVRNVFYDLDHALLLKDGSSALFENNTVFDASIAAINFGEPERGTGYGAGATVRGNIFRDCVATFKNVIPSVALTADLNNMPVVDHVHGVDNVDVDPFFVDSTAGDFRLQFGSPVSGLGPNGVDMGAHVPQWNSISGFPPSVTASNSVNLVIGGPGIIAYRYALDGGAFGVETTIDNPINLTGLAAGSHQVTLIGQNSAGVWQDEAEPTVAASWAVDSSASSIRINELLASNSSVLALADGSYPDVIELYNAGGMSVDLSGFQLSDDALEPDKFVIPSGTTLAPDSRLLLYGDTGTEPGALFVGFSLRSGGELLQLLDASGTPVDSVAYGLQADDFSIGVIDNLGTWGLCIPTLGTPNQLATLGSSEQITINEWLSSPEVMLGGDFVELYNPSTFAVSIDGLFLSDSPFGDPLKQSVPPLSYIAPGGFAAFYRDREGQPDGLEFGLNSFSGRIALLDSNGAIFDQISYSSLGKDHSGGRNPDGSNILANFEIPTPGFSNADAVTLTELLSGLRITEIHYNPTGGSDAEYLEFRNVGATTLELEGVEIDSAIEFTFGAESLAPGERILVASDLSVFAAEYGSGLRVVGPFSGKLSNGGEDVLVLMPSPSTLAIQRFEYDDKWYPSTDGSGFSLIVVDPQAAVGEWSNPDQWQASSQVGGTPNGSTMEANIEGDAYLSIPADRILSGSLADEGLSVASSGAIFSWSQVAGPTALLSTPGEMSTVISYTQPGVYRLRLEVDTGLELLASELDVVVGDSFNTWLDRNFTVGELNDASVSSPSSDPDRDGRSNLEEYAFGTDPRISDFTCDWGIEVLSDGQPIVRYPTPSWVSDVAYILEYSTDLVVWHDDPTLHKIVNSIGGANGIDVVEVQTVIPGIRGFYRIRFEVVE